MSKERLKILQVLVLALISGLLLFAILSTLVTGPGKLRFYCDTTGALLAGATFLFLATSFTVSKLLDRATEDSLRGSGTTAEIDDRLFDRLQQRTILGSAVLEGGAFLLLVLNIFWSNFLLLLLAALLVIGLSFYFPSESRVKNWFARRREGITQRKSLE
jgi:hypothetical protein